MGGHWRFGRSHVGGKFRSHYRDERVLYAPRYSARLEVSILSTGMTPCLTFLKPVLAICLSADLGSAAVDLSGFWERRDTAGSGAWENIDAKIPKAVLLRPAAT